MTTPTEACMPGPEDMARAAAVLAAQTRLDIAALLTLYTELVELPDAPAALFRLVIALAEHVVKGMRFREDPAAFQALLNDLAHYYTKGTNDE